VKKGQPTFIAEVSNALFHAAEDEEVYVQPPGERVEAHAASGGDVYVVWRLRRQLHGRRRAGQAWLDHAATVLRDLGFSRCPAAPCFFVDKARGFAIELHMGNFYGTGPEEAVRSFLVDWPTS
jgi:hypothetical protein